MSSSWTTFTSAMATPTRPRSWSIVVIGPPPTSHGCQSMARTVRRRTVRRKSGDSGIGQEVALAQQRLTFSSGGALPRPAAPARERSDVDPAAVSVDRRHDLWTGCRCLIVSAPGDPQDVATPLFINRDLEYDWLI